MALPVLGDWCCCWLRVLQCSSSISFATCSLDVCDEMPCTQTEVVGSLRVYSTCAELCPAATMRWCLRFTTTVSNICRGESTRELVSVRVMWSHVPVVFGCTLVSIPMSIVFGVTLGSNGVDRSGSVRSGSSPLCMLTAQLSWEVQWFTVRAQFGGGGLSVPFVNSLTMIAVCDDWN